MIASLVISLGLTLLIELLVALILGIRNKEDMLIVILVNTLTNPVVVFCANCILLLESNLVYNVYVAVVEVLVVMIEWKIYQSFFSERYQHSSFFLSLICNLSSFLFGMIVNFIIK